MADPTKGQSELLKLQIENQKKDPGFNKKSKEMTEKMIEENEFKSFNKSDRKSDLLEKMIKGKKYRKVNDNQKDVKQDDKYRLMTEKNTAEPKSKKFKAGGRVEYKHGGGVGCAKRGFNKKILKKGKK